MPLPDGHFDLSSISSEKTPQTHSVRVETPAGSLVVTKRADRAPLVEIDGPQQDALIALDHLLTILAQIRLKLIGA